MRRAIFLAAVCVVSQANAQAAATAPASPERSPQAGVINYPASFFADARPNTALDMINRLPGFSFDAGESVRGFAGAAGNVLIDGRRPASKSDDLGSVLNRIAASDVERIELIRGGAPGIDMQGRTVIANVVRKTGDSNRLTFSAGQNIFANGRTIPNGKIEVSRRVGARTYEASLARYASLDDSIGDGRLTTVDAAGVRSTPARTTAAGGGVGLTASVKSPLAGGEVRVNLKLEETYFRSGLSYGAPPDVIVNDRSRTRDGELGLNYDRKFGKLEFEAVALQKLERDFNGEAADYPALHATFSSVNDTGESILRATLRYPLFTDVTLEGGGEGAYNVLDGRTHYAENGAPIALPSANVRVEERRGEAFAQATWKPTRALTLEAGARVEVSTIAESGDARLQRSFFYPKPRLLATWTPDKDSQVRLRLERKVGQLNFGDFVSSADLKSSIVSVGNPNLRPDQRWIYEASYERRFWRKGAVVATVTHEAINDINDFVPIVGPGFAFDAPGNIGRGSIDTLDIEATLPLDRVGIKGGLLKTTSLWRNSEVTDPVTRQKRRISGQRPDVLQAEFSQDIARLKSTWGFTYFNGWRETYYRLFEVQRFRIPPPYVQAFWEYKPRADLSFRVELDNLVPFHFQRIRTIYAGPRDTAAVAEQEYRDIQSQRRIYVRVRKTFGR